jgi:hypothetical protein
VTVPEDDQDRHHQDDQDQADSPGTGPGPLRDLLHTPWPGLDPLLHLRTGHLIVLGVDPGAAEARLGEELAVHAADVGVHTYLFAPGSSIASLSPRLQVRRGTPLTVETIEQCLASLAGTSRATQLVVIDPFHRLRDDDEQPLHEEDQAIEIGRRLKIRAGAGPYAIVVLAHLAAAPDASDDAPPSQTGSLSRLGLAAELEYDADTVLLLHRTDQHSVDVHVAKDRFGPARFTTTLPWPAPSAPTPQP